MLDVENSVQHWVGLIVDATVSVSSDDSFNAFLTQAHADLDNSSKDLDEQERGDMAAKPAAKPDPEEDQSKTAEELFDPSIEEDAGAMGISCISSLSFEDDEFGLADDEWTVGADDLDDDKSWVPAALEHRAAIEKTGSG